MLKLYQFLLLPILFLILVSCGTTHNNTTSNTPTEPTSNGQPSTPAPNTPAPTSTPTSHTSIDVLVLYDKEVQSSYSDINARINHLFAVSNNIYSDSQLNITINAKKILFFDAQSHPALDEVAASA